MGFAGFVGYRGLVPGDALAPELKRQPLAMWLGPGRLFMRYRLRGGALYNFVAVARRGDWVEDGWSVPAKVAEVLGEFADFDPMVLRTVALTPGGTLYRWGLFAHRPLDTWVSARVALLGDAAHAMPPFLGQGAAMANEDGVVLGRALAILEAIPEALQRYSPHASAAPTPCCRPPGRQLRSISATTRGRRWRPWRRAWRRSVSCTPTTLPRRSADPPPGV